MRYFKKLLSFTFLVLMGLALWQCAKRGNPTGGPKDLTPPQLLRTEPDNYTTEFKAKKIRLYFDELIKLEDVQNQLIVSPPLKYPTEIRPLGGANKYVEVTIKDTLQDNTTYTFNFGQSIVDNNEGNPNSFLTYVFSTGTYIDSLSLTGAVKDAFNRVADEFVSVMLYEIDTAYTDSTIYKKVPNYISNTLDSLPVFELKNLKAGDYALIALKDVNKNNMFNQRQDKIGFLTDTISIPTDSVYLLTLFQEEPDYSVSVPSYMAKNHILFGYQGDYHDIEINTLTELPDSVQTLIFKDREKDTLDYWISPTDLDSIIFTVSNEKLDIIDTFTLKNRNLPLDSLKLTPGVSGTLNFEDSYSILANTPIAAIDSNQIALFVSDSINMPYSYTIDSLKNQIDFDFDLEPNQKYSFEIMPGAVTDFFGIQNDTLNYRFSTGSYADYGNLRFNIGGAVKYPLILQLTNEREEVQRELFATEPKIFEFANLEPGNYMVRVIFDANGNQKWDTGSYLLKRQPERVSYYPDVIDVRANWELEQTFVISN
ncbi:Ig-like domain-containing protein [Muricauda sp. 2012CJ35-5]|uniref:Ig-like domain-containing protein n=1 Tax=Flagellimonas spongiicola TaxID=2942208 RepID=A0ABT0PRN4_9FLAO|nr:Ig-like domain-containing protein [Allomuricauda spongiicola]MCL6274038.1 Ig-like domain-containing protein [Allomuricauda spongiicola]